MTKIRARRTTLLALAALCAAGILAFTFTTPTVEAAVDDCPWLAHTEIDFFDNPQKTGPPVGWKVYTCTFCNVYSGGTTTPYYTIINETPCPDW